MYVHTREMSIVTHHVRAASRPVHCEESQASTVQPIQMVECVCQQLTGERKNREIQTSRERVKRERE